jgi:acylpyruvate hydrolase
MRKNSPLPRRPPAHSPSDHVKELNNKAPKQPFFFLKPPSSILLPGAGPVLRPRGVNLHYEVELGLIMGKTVRDLHPEDTKGALDAIEGEILICCFTNRIRIYIFNTI